MEPEAWKSYLCWGPNSGCPASQFSYCQTGSLVTLFNKLCFRSVNKLESRPLKNEFKSDSKLQSNNFSTKTTAVPVTAFEDRIKVPDKQELAT